MKNNLIVIIGPTASGKTKLAAALASKIDGEIISADSRQVYRRMDIGTGKDYEDYEVNGTQIPFHLIDIVDAGKKYNVASFQKDFKNSFQAISERKKVPVLCGGSGMYVDAVLDDFQFTNIPPNEESRANLSVLKHEELLKIYLRFENNSAHQFDTNSTKRLVRAIEILDFQSKNNISESKNVLLNPIIFCTHLSAEKRQIKILNRLQFRLKNGLIEEVENLLASGISAEDLIYYGLEYKFVTEHLISKFTFEELEEKLFFAIRQFAKRQMTYFRGMERKGKTIFWLDAEENIEHNCKIIMEQWKKN